MHRLYMTSRLQQPSKLPIRDDRRTGTNCMVTTKITSLNSILVVVAAKFSGECFHVLTGARQVDNNNNNDYILWLEDTVTQILSNQTTSQFFTINF